MRCPECQKFVSFDTDLDPEVTVDIDAGGMVSGECRIVNVCAECGTELKSADFEIDHDFSDVLDAHTKAHPDNTHEFSVEESSTRTERTQTEGRNGKPLTGPARYRKHYYGAEVALTVSCACGEEVADGDATWTDEVQASGMEEC